MKNFTSKNILMCGMTGSGKSIFLHKMVTYLLNENSPQDLRLILIDPKRVEFSLYKDMPHLLADVIVDNGKAESAFKWAWNEAMNRLDKMRQLNCSSIEKYNKLKYNNKKFPKIYIIIDEFSDLTRAGNKNFFEEYFEKITAISKLTGIYLIISTSIPSTVDVTTKKIRDCFTTRIAFRLYDAISSMVVLGEEGAEKLAGNGDCLVKELLDFKIKRLQILFISDGEINNTIERTKEKYANFQDLQTEHTKREEEDNLYPQAKAVVMEYGKASASLIQRKLKTGYARSARLLDMLEEDGIVGPANGIEPREVYKK